VQNINLNNCWDCLSHPKLVQIGAAWRFGALNSKFTVDQRVSNVAFHNFSDTTFDSNIQHLLGLGLKFIPFPPSTTTPLLLLSEFDNMLRRIRLRVQFADSQRDAYVERYMLEHAFGNDIPPREIPIRFKFPNPAFQPRMLPPPIEEVFLQARDTFERRIRMSLANRSRHSRKNSLASQLQTLNEHYPDLVFTAADKNLGLVCVTRSWYNEHVLEILNDPVTYSPLASDNIPDFQNRCLKAFLRLLHLHGIHISLIGPTKYHCSTVFKSLGFTSIPIDFLVTYALNTIRSKSWAAKFYGIVKIHKTPLKLRPISPAHSVPACKFADWIVAELQTFVWQCEFVLKDSRTLIRKLEQVRIPYNAVLISIDVDNMYPSIPRSRLYFTLRRFFKRFVRDVDIPYVDFLLDVIQWAQDYHVVSFENHFWLQIEGVAMGIHFGPLVANAFLGELEYQARERWISDGLEWPLVYGRYIDDAFAILVPSTPNYRQCPTINAFIDLLRSLDPSMKLTISISEDSADFLDLHLYKGTRFRDHGHMDITTYAKSISRYLYVPFSSCHARANLSAFIKAELIRLVVTNSDFDQYISKRASFWFHLRQRGYPPSYLRELFPRVEYNRRALYLAESVADTRSALTKSFQQWLKKPVVYKMQVDRNIRDKHLAIGRLLTLTMLPILQSHRLLNDHIDLQRPFLVAYRNSPSIRTIIASHHLHSSPVTDEVADRPS